MTKKTHIWQEKTIETEGQIFINVVIENQDQQRSNLWYRLPLEHRHLVTKTCDPFVVAMIFNAMRKPADLIVHGEVSLSLLRNLEEFQAIWNCWLPERYTKIEIKAGIKWQKPKANHSEKAVMAFSGGVDSCFTAWRHRRDFCGRSRRNLQAAVMIHGFDIPLEEKDVFERAAEKSKKMLEPLGVTLIPVATNFRNLGGHWGDVHVAGLVSSLMLLQSCYGVGLIASSVTYNNISTLSPWGSNPVTDHLLSNDSFELISDGSAFTRIEKIRAISNWPQALRYLRVCWEGEKKDRNCCRCEKCIRNILNFRIVGLGLPGCFEHDVTDSQIAAIKGLNTQLVFIYKKMLSDAKAAGICDSWVAALGRCIKQNEDVLNRRRGLLQRIRKTVALRTRVRRLLPSGTKGEFLNIEHSTSNIEYGGR